MITAADLRSCRSAHEASLLLVRLGWPAAPRRIDPGQWRSIEGATIDGVDAWHLMRHAGVDLYAFEARDERSRGAITPFLRGLSRWNRVLEPTALYFPPSRDSMSLYGCRGTRRLDVALDMPSADAVDRIASLELRGGFRIARRANSLYQGARPGGERASFLRALSKGIADDRRRGGQCTARREP